MARFFIWFSHRDPDSSQLTGFSGLFAGSNISARISAQGMKPVASSNRQIAYRALVEELAHAMLNAVSEPNGISEARPDIAEYQTKWPFRAIPAQPSTARVSGGGVEMTVYASVHGKSPDGFQTQVPMTPDEARQLADLPDKSGG